MKELARFDRKFHPAWSWKSDGNQFSMELSDLSWSEVERACGASLQFLPCCLRDSFYVYTEHYGTRKYFVARDDKRRRVELMVQDNGHWTVDPVDPTNSTASDREKKLNIDDRRLARVFLQLRVAKTQNEFESVVRGTFPEDPIRQFLLVLLYAANGSIQRQRLTVSNSFHYSKQ